MNIDASLLEMGPAQMYVYEKPAAVLVTALVGVDNDLRIEAQKGGVAGNSITIELIDPPGNNVPASVAVVGTAISVTLATDGTSTIVSTAKQVRDLLNADLKVFSLVKTTLKGPDDGTGLVTALAATPLAGGSDTAVAVDLGALGDDVQVTVATEAGVLTAAQTGTIPQKKVVTGGRFQIAVPLKQMSLANWQRAFPNSVLFDDGNGKQKLAFRSRVGLDLRSIAKKLEIRKVVGGVESTAPKDILIVYEASPVDGDVLVPYQPTEQRVITATFEAWPDSAGEWGSYGDQDL
jgi:hypothetical protein